jgi:hypothetical protein
LTAQEQEKERERQKVKEKEKEKKAEKKTDEESSDEEEMDRSMDADDFAIGLGLSCVVCKYVCCQSYHIDEGPLIKITSHFTNA